MSDPEFIDPKQINSGPIRHGSLSPDVIEIMEGVYSMIGPYLGTTLEQLEVTLMRDSEPDNEAIVWASIAAAWQDYHSMYLNDEVLADDQEKKLIATLIAISTGMEDMTKLSVSLEVGRRLLACYDALADE